MKSIAIDLAISKPIAFVVFEDRKIIHIETTPRKGYTGLNALLKNIESKAFGEIGLIITEKPYLKSNPRFLSDISEMVGYLKHFCEKNNIKLVQVMPAHWKKAYLKKTSISAKSKQANSILKHIAISLSGKKNLNPDERDALLFGIYAIMREIKCFPTSR